jgi:hypothetical protein
MARCRVDIRSLGSDARVGLDWLPHVRQAKYNTATHPFVAFDFCLCGIRVCPFQVARFLNGAIDVSRDARFWRSRRQRRIWLFGVVSGYRAYPTPCYRNSIRTDRRLPNGIRPWASGLFAFCCLRSLGTPLNLLFIFNSEVAVSICLARRFAFSRPLRPQSRFRSSHGRNQSFSAR